MSSDVWTGADESAPPDIPPAPARRVPLWGKVGIGASVALAVIVIAGFVIHVPYTTISPGATVALRDKVQVSGTQTYQADRGDIRLLFVRERAHVSLWNYVIGYFDTNTDIVKDSVFNPDNQPQRRVNEQSAQEMTDAKNAATKVALEAAGYHVGVLPGLIARDFQAGAPADKALDYGDIIVSADGKTVATAKNLSDAIARHKVGEKVALGIVRGGKRMTIDVGVALNKDNGRRIIGVVLSPRFNFPFKVSVDTAGIGGPSAGLAMTLAILDDLTPGNLTGGLRVAVTGTIKPDGTVGPIGGILQKAVAVRAAGARIFIVPKCVTGDTACALELQRVGQRVGNKIKVMPVATFQDALEVLRAAGGAPVVPVAAPSAA